MISTIDDISTDFLHFQIKAVVDKLNNETIPYINEFLESLGADI